MPRWQDDGRHPDLEATRSTAQRGLRLVVGQSPFDIWEGRKHNTKVCSCGRRQVVTCLFGEPRGFRTPRPRDGCLRRSWPVGAVQTVPEEGEHG